MFNSRRIPTSWSHWWRRLRSQLLPLLSFVACTAAMIWLWDRQGQIPNAIGEVEAVRIAVASGADGVLATVSQDQPQWSLFDVVERDEVIARLDDRPVQAELATFVKRRVEAEKKLDATSARFAVNEEKNLLDRLREASRLARQVERYRLDALDRNVTIERDRVELQRREARLKYLQTVHQQDPVTVTDQMVFEYRLMRDQLATRIEENIKAKDLAEQLAAEATQRFADLPGPIVAEMDKILAPVRAAIDVEEARMDELKVQIELLQIRAPFRGTISAVHAWPGQAVREGDPIITIAAQQGRYIVSYVRQRQRIQVEVDMVVHVRHRMPGARSLETKIERVGPQFEPVPLQQLSDPRVPEWGLPVRISIPANLATRPGELLDLTFE